VAGRIDVLAGSMSNAVQLQQEGQDVKVFCPVTGESTEHLVGVGGITDLADITQPEIVVGIDSPGGLVNYLMNHVFRARGLTNESGEPLTVDDLANVQILEDGGLRLAALASGDINVGSVELVEAAQLADEIGEENVTILSSAAKDIEQALGVVYSAKTEWIEENPDRAAAFCATVLKANRELAGDFDEYESWANQMIDPDPDPEALRANWEFGRENDVWPYNNTFSEEAFTNDMEVLAASGMIDPDALEIGYEELVDVATVDAAVELLGGEVDQSEVETGG